VRPSLLGQTRYRSFRLDLSGGLLSLSMSSLLTAGRPAIPIADMRRLGAPSQQYVARVRRLHINGRPVLTDRPVYAMLDSGSTGLFVTDTLFYEILMMIESWHSCRVELAARDGTCQALAASRSSPLFMCLPTRFPWLGSEEGHMLVLGMCFLQGRTLSVDVETSLMQIGSREA